MKFKSGLRSSYIHFHVMFNRKPFYKQTKSEMNNDRRQKASSMISEPTRNNTPQDSGNRHSVSPEIVCHAIECRTHRNGMPQLKFK